MSSDGSRRCTPTGYRFVVLVITAIHLALILCSVVTFNSAFVSLQDLASSPLYTAFISGNLTDPDWSSSELSLADRRFIWTPIQKSLAFAGAFGGAFVCVLPMGFVIRRFGVHKTMTVLGTLGALTVAASPFSLVWNYGFFVFLRCINGLTFSVLFTVAGSVCNEWAPLNERGIFIAVLTGHVEVAALFTMPSGAFLSSSLGWPYTFWIHGTLLLISTILWTLLYRDKPCEHPFVTVQEAETIAFGKKEQPAKVELVIKIFTGLMSDKITCIDEVMKMRLFNTIALIGCAVFFSIATVVTPAPNFLDSFLALAPVALLGFHAGGFPKCLVMVSRQYSSFIMSVVQMVACASMLAGSFVVPLMTPNNTFEEWRGVFILYAVLTTLSNSVFVMFARSKPGSWTESSRRKAQIIK